jgi:hypothetical protein
MTKANSQNRCQHISALGRRCRERRSNTHSSLCPRHARHEQNQKDAQRQMDDDPQALAADFLGPIQDFRTASSVNHVLGKLLLLLTTDRISPRNAAVTAYICQLLLQSVGGVKSELWDFHNIPARNSPEINKAINQILKAKPSIVPPAHPANSGSVPPVHPARARAVAPQVHRAKSESVPPVYQARSEWVAPAVPPAHPAKSESIPPVHQANASTISPVPPAVPPVQQAKSESVPPAPPLAQPPKPQPLGFVELPRLAKFRHLHGYR